MGCSYALLSFSAKSKGRGILAAKVPVFFFFFSSMGQACCALHYYYSFIFTSALVVSYMLHYFGASLTCVCVCVQRCLCFLSLSLLCTVYATCRNQGGCIWPRLSSLLAPVRLVFPSPKSNINKHSHRGFVVEQAEFRCSLSFLGVHFYCNFYCG